MGTLQDAFVQAMPAMIGTAVGVIGSRLVDVVLPPKSSRDLFNEYYKAVESSELPPTVADADAILHHTAAPRPAARLPPQPVKKQYNAAGKGDMAVMTDEIQQAITSLKTAKEHTRCSLCRATLTELEEDVQKKTEFIRQSTTMWNAMQDMKERGDLPEDAAWSDLTDEQKQMVKQYANQ